MNAVEELARWLHVAFCRKRGREWLSAGHMPQLWANLPERRRDDYRAVARELLENPPPCLCVPGIALEARTQ